MITSAPLVLQLPFMVEIMIRSHKYETGEEAHLYEYCDNRKGTWSKAYGGNTALYSPTLLLIHLRQGKAKIHMFYESHNRKKVKYE